MIAILWLYCFGVVISGNIIVVSLGLISLAIVTVSYFFSKLRRYFKVLTGVAFLLLFYTGLQLSSINEMATALVVVMVSMLYQDRKYVAYMSGIYIFMAGFFSIVVDGAFVSVAVTQAGGSTNAAVGADHALDEIVWQQAFAGTQEGSFAAVDAVADDRVEHERLTVGAVSITSPIAGCRFARSSSLAGCHSPASACTVWGISLCSFCRSLLFAHRLGDRFT